VETANGTGHVSLRGNSWKASRLTLETDPFKDAHRFFAAWGDARGIEVSYEDMATNPARKRLGLDTEGSRYLRDSNVTGRT